MEALFVRQGGLVRRRTGARSPPPPPAAPVLVRLRPQSAPPDPSAPRPADVRIVAPVAVRLVARRRRVQASLPPPPPPPAPLGLPPPPPYPGPADWGWSPVATAPPPPPPYPLVMQGVPVDPRALPLTPPVPLTPVRPLLPPALCVPAPPPPPPPPPASARKRPCPSSPAAPPAKARRRSSAGAPAGSSAAMDVSQSPPPWELLPPAATPLSPPPLLPASPPGAGGPRAEAVQAQTLHVIRSIMEEADKLKQLHGMTNADMAALVGKCKGEHYSNMRLAALRGTFNGGNAALDFYRRVWNVVHVRPDSPQAQQLHQRCEAIVAARKRGQQGAARRASVCSPPPTPGTPLLPPSPVPAQPLDGADDAPASKRQRQSLSEQARAVMQAFWDTKSHYPGPADLQDLAACDPTLTSKRVHTWFQNKRTRESKRKFSTVPVPLDTVLAAVTSGSTVAADATPAAAPAPAPASAPASSSAARSLFFS